MVETNSLSWWHVLSFLGIVVAGMWLARKSRSRGLSAIICFIMICVAGLRHGYIDTRSYRTSFENLEIDKVLNLNFIFDSEAKDKGFSVLSALIKTVTDNSQIFLFIISFITVGFLFWGIVNRVPEIDLGIYLFITTGCYLDTMNGIRQALVSAILFYFFPKLLDKEKTIQCVVLILILSTIHGSALIFIPIYFIGKKKAWSNYTIILIIVSGLLYIFFNTGVGATLANILEGTNYGNDYSQMLLSGNTSVNILRIIIAAVPLGLSLITRQYKRNKQTSYNLFFNMTLLNFMTWLFASRVLYFYRLAMYFAPYMIVFLCFELCGIQSKKQYRFIKLAAIFFYFIYFIYQLYIMGDQFFVGYLRY